MSCRAVSYYIWYAPVSLSREAKNFAQRGNFFTKKFGTYRNYSYLCNVKIIQVAEKMPPQQAAIFVPQEKIRDSDLLYKKPTAPRGVWDNHSKGFSPE